MTEAPQKFSMQGLADSVELLRAGRVERVALLRRQIGAREVRRSLDDVARMEKAIPTLERAALVFKTLAANRDNLPRWIVALIEDGEPPDT